MTLGDIAEKTPGATLSPGLGGMILRRGYFQVAHVAGAYQCWLTTGKKTYLHDKTTDPDLARAFLMCGVATKRAMDEVDEVTTEETTEAEE